MTSTAACFFSEESPKQRDQDEIIEILGQAKPSEWHEAIVAANIDIFEEESVSYFKLLEDLEKIRCTNVTACTTLTLPRM